MIKDIIFTVIICVLVIIVVSLISSKFIKARHSEIISHYLLIISALLGIVLYKYKTIFVPILFSVSVGFTFHVEFIKEIIQSIKKKLSK